MKAANDKEVKDLIASKEAKVTPDGLGGGRAHTQVSGDEGCEGCG